MPNPQDPNLDSSDAVPPDRTAFELRGELKSFEAHLAALVPRSDRLDRERLAFLAGQASMAPSLSGSPTVEANWRRHPAWPAAFAGMSAVAALLFVALILQPRASNVASMSGAARGPRDTGAIAKKVPQSTLVLSARDARSGDIEARLDRVASSRIENDDVSESTADPDVPVFTPTAWQQVIDNVESVEKFPHRSSSFRRSRDVRS